MKRKIFYRLTEILSFYAFLRPDYSDSGFIQRAKTGVHSNQEQQSVSTITDNIEQKKGKQY